MDTLSPARSADAASGTFLTFSLHTASGRLYNCSYSPRSPSSPTPAATATVTATDCISDASSSSRSSSDATDPAALSATLADWSQLTFFSPSQTLFPSLAVTSAAAQSAAAAAATATAAAAAPSSSHISNTPSAATLDAHAASSSPRHAQPRQHHRALHSRLVSQGLDIVLLRMHSGRPTALADRKIRKLAKKRLKALRLKKVLSATVSNPWLPFTDIHAASCWYETTQQQVKASCAAFHEALKEEQLLDSRAVESGAASAQRKSSSAPRNPASDSAAAHTALTSTSSPVTKSAGTAVPAPAATPAAAPPTNTTNSGRDITRDMDLPDWSQLFHELERQEPSVPAPASMAQIEAALAMNSSVAFYTPSAVDKDDVSSSQLLRQFSVLLARSESVAHRASHYLLEPSVSSSPSLLLSRSGTFSRTPSGGTALWRRSGSLKSPLTNLGLVQAAPHIPHLSHVPPPAQTLSRSVSFGALSLPEAVTQSVDMYAASFSLLPPISEGSLLPDSLDEMDIEWDAILSGSQGGVSNNVCAGTSSNPDAPTTSTTSTTSSSSSADKCTRADTGKPHDTFREDAQVENKDSNAALALAPAPALVYVPTQLVAHSQSRSNSSMFMSAASQSAAATATGGNQFSPPSSPFVFSSSTHPRWMDKSKLPKSPSSSFLSAPLIPDIPSPCT